MTIKIGYQCNSMVKQREYKSNSVSNKELSEKLLITIIVLTIFTFALALIYISDTSVKIVYVSNESVINVINKSSKDLIFEFSNDTSIIVKSNSSLVHNFNETMDLIIHDYYESIDNDKGFTKDELIVICKILMISVFSLFVILLCILLVYVL
jgi:hypothetical protein